MSAVPDIAIPRSLFDGRYYLSIAGQLVESTASFDVINPASGQVFATAPSATPQQLDDAIAVHEPEDRAYSKVRPRCSAKVSWIGSRRQRRCEVAYAVALPA